MIRAKTKIDAPQIPQGLDHQSRAHQKRKSHRELRHDQSVSQTRAASRFAGSPAFLKRFLERNIRRPQRRHHAKKYTRQNRDGRRKQQHRRVQRKAFSSNLRRNEVFKYAPAKPANEQPRPSSTGGKQQAFRNELRSDLPPARAQSDAHRNFAASSSCARQEKIRQI